MGIELVMVFDGAPMPCKENTEEERRVSRLDALKKAEEFEKVGNTKEAERYYTRAVDVTPFLAKEVIEELQKYNVECIVAPYEADAQLAYLCKIGYVSGVISEDSDLIVFESTKILYKLENNGTVKELLLSDLWNHPNYNLKKWDQDKLITMCVLAGCDYLKSFKNIGLKTAYKYVSQYSELKQIISKLKREIGKIPEDYEEQFMKAVNSFKYHQVFCPLTSEMVYLNPMPLEVAQGDLTYLGIHFEQEVMIGIAKGRVHPFTKESFNSVNLKRKINEIYQPVLKITQVKKIKVADEAKSLAQKIRIDKNTQKSKYFEAKTDENEETIEENRGNSTELNKEVTTKYKPHTFPINSDHSLQSLENFRFRRIDLRSIFLGN